MVDAAAIEHCPVCEAGESIFFRRIDGYDYFQCAGCGSLHIDNATLDAIDAGHSTRVYDASYWRDELIAARERAQGVALVRVSEAILYARRPVTRFLDVGCGPGYLLDELVRFFPSHTGMFHGVELYPPEQHSSHPNYHAGDVGHLLEKFDAGVCIEVIEHLTPTMLSGLVRNLARVSEPGALWLFNTGMPDLVLQHDPGYLDPRYRGHIVSYSLDGLRHLFEPFGFRLSPVPGKNYVFMAEYRPGDSGIEFERRVREPLPGNMALLQEAQLILQAALETGRYSICEEQLASRTQWAHSLEAQAHSLDAELTALRENHATLRIEHDRVIHSRSWMLTRPLRRVANWWRSGRHAPDREGDRHEPH